MDAAQEGFHNFPKEYDKEYKLRAKQNAAYAQNQYAVHMGRERLYAETDKRRK